MSASASFPKIPLLLGLGGVVPFVALSMAIAWGFVIPGFEDGDSMRAALVGYGVAILSFLGGVRWGLAIKQGEDGGSKADRDFIISVIPPLVAWFAWFQTSPADLWWLSAAHVLLGLLDYGLACRIVVPEWYGKMRLALAGIAALSLMLAALTTA